MSPIVPQFSLPTTVTLKKAIMSGSPSASNRSNFVDLVITDGGILNGTRDGYCMNERTAIDWEQDDNNNGVIDPNEVGTSYKARVYSSYSSELPAIIEQPGNLDLINWILNQDFAGQASAGGFGNYAAMDIQQAMWVLINNDYSLPAEDSGTDWYQRSLEIISLARANGEGFVPGLGQKVGVLIIPDDNNDGIADAQPMITAVPVSELQIQPASLGDRVWNDCNKNGIQDAGEAGVAGVKVTLLGGGADQILGTGDDTSTTLTTDAKGNYKFTDLVAGTQYQVAFSNLPTGFQFTSANVGNDALDSDVDATGKTQVITLAAGEHNATLDAGIFLKPVISAALQGTTQICEGGQGGYTIKLDQVSDRDRYFTIQIDNGTAKRVDHWAGNQDIMWGGSYDTRNSRGQVIKETFGFVAQGRAGDTSDDRKMVGPADASWDFTVYKNGQIDAGNTVTVKVAAGQSVSESFQVQTWQERVTVDRDHYKLSSRTGYDEGIENFSMKIIAADADKVTTGSIGVSIHDKTTYDFVSPIALDLNGDGIQTLSINQGIQFDLLNSGTKVNTGWLSGGDGFLALDANGNGQIDDRSELFGGAVGEGFGKLSSFDSNGDGWVNAQDDRFGDLLVWQDGNQNALTEDGELRSLAAAGISGLNTRYSSAFNLDAQGNVLGETSVARTTGGQDLAMVDVYFQVATNPLMPVGAGL